MVACAAALWCATFACLHLFWALGGSTGLASSAGSSLATHRPAAFVIFGLYGVAMLLLIGIAIIAAMCGTRVSRPQRRALATLVAVAGAALVIRGGALEALLELNAGGIRTTVGPLETRWSMLVWNPWFVLGGALFIVTAFLTSPPAFLRSGPQ